MPTQRSYGDFDRAYLDLQEDYWAADAELRADPTSPYRRRNLVRCAFAAIEGLVSSMRHDTLTRDDASVVYLPEETTILREEGYGLGKHGKIEKHMKHFDLPSSWLFVLRLHFRGKVDVNVDTASEGWAKLKKAVNIRHRVTHPRFAADIALSNDDITVVRDAFKWVEGVSAKFLSEEVDMLEAEVARAREELEAQLALGSPLLQLRRAFASGLRPDPVDLES